MLYAMIDIGSNTIRLAIYQIKGAQVAMLMKKKHTVGLASYVKDGAMQQAGIDKAVEILQEFQGFLKALHISRVTAFTTAALRNAVNSREAVREVEARTGLSIEVISGEAEAEYDFLGATHNLTEKAGLLMDIGGASTELVYYEDKEIVKKASLGMGSLGYHTLYVAGLLPTAAECAAMRQAAEAAIREAKDFARISQVPICGIGGTFKGAVALYNSLYQMPKENFRMETGRLGYMIRRFQTEGIVPPDNAILLMKTVPDRMHTLLPGLIIAEAAAQYFESSMIAYSDSGVREGYIYKHIVNRKDS